MNFMNQQAMLIGYALELAAIVWIGWYAIAAAGRRWAGRQERAIQRAKARVQAQPALDYPSDFHPGESWAPPQPKV